MGFARILLLLLLAGLGCAAPARADPPLRAPLERALQAPGLRGAVVGALVVSADDGSVLYAREADRSLVPASNLKVLTAAAALSRFGPTHRFVTEVWADAVPDAEGTVQTLAVRGGGDPTLTSEQWWRLAADLRARGLRRVRGDVLLDAGRFDAVRWHPAWGNVSSRAYHAPVAALSANYGAFEVWIEPGSEVGAPGAVRVDPPVPYLRVSNRVKTGPAGRRPALRVDREAEGGVERVTVSGSIALGAEPKRFARSVTDPVRYAGAVLRMQLGGLGIRVDGKIQPGVVPEPAVRLHDFEGFPVAEVVRRFMKWSNNAIGEHLLKAMAHEASGRPGSSGGGVAEVRRELGGLGLDLDGLTLVDGSGLAYDNRVSPRLLVETLRRARGSFDFGPEFTSALPIAASDGTLEKRARGAVGAVRAKTGLLNRITGLSGFARTREGSHVVFSILVNGYRAGDAAAMDAIDGFVTALVGGPVPASRPPEALGSSPTSRPDAAGPAPASRSPEAAGGLPASRSPEAADKG